MRKKSPPKRPAPTEEAVGDFGGAGASEAGLDSDGWRTAFESPDDLWMRFLARAEKDESVGESALREWLTSEELSEAAQHEWRLLGGAEPTSED